ncbi:MAG TPA: hypothetical protein VK912_15505 [Longimicrobiales bacterium]|nr:hypothetical protein [Longimicrobiales bacterium]
MDAKPNRVDGPHAGPGMHVFSRMCSPVAIRIAADEAAIQQLLELRTAIYRGVGKWRHVIPMVDPFDYESGAVHIGAWCNEILIGAARILVRPPGEEYEHDRFLSWDDVGLPAREACVEMFGAISTGYTFVHSDLGPKSHTMLHADVPGGITGRTTSWPVWAALWAPVALRAHRAGLLHPGEGPMRRAVALAHAQLACALPLGRLRWRP